MRDIVLSVRQVSWHNGIRPVIGDVSLDVATHEFVAVMGRNGAGKSTLLDTIAGLKAASTGHVMLMGRPQDCRAPVACARVLAHLPQQVRADVALRVEDLVLMGRYAHATRWFESARDFALAEEAMRRCDCLQFRQRRIATLSGGERQRVFLAACLAQQPRVLVLDEPATFLDVDQQLHCFTVLRDEAARGTACLAVTHDINLALTFCSRVIVMADGAVVRDLPVAGALDAPAWLQLISSRLHVETSGKGAWVCYR